MEWYLVILLFFILLLFFVFLGMPIAFAFLTSNIILATILMGFSSGVLNLVNSSFEALTRFSLTPIPLFILMGELLFHSGMVMKVLDSFSKLLGRVPSRLSILAIGSGTMFSALSGSAIANAAMLGSSLTPEMLKRGYHIKMIVGPILAAGSLALIIPPSTTAVLLGSIGRISVGDLLIAGIIPGLFIASMILIYFMVLGFIKPSLAPIYDVQRSSLSEKMKSLLIDAAPTIILILVVLGVIFAGYATPTESAAIGALGAIFIPLLYGKLNKNVLFQSIKGTLRVSSMILLILATSAVFSQLLAYSGATRDLVDTVLAMDILPILTILAMLLIVLILGTFIEPISIMMITIPLYIPVVTALEYDVVWFGIVFLICLGLGNITPPFGLLLFVMKGVVPKNISIKNIYLSVTGIIAIQLVGVAILVIFPDIVTWLPYLNDAP